MIKYTPLKSKVIRYSGRSSDFIFPSISQGCFGGCLYCYAARHTDLFRNNLKISSNINEIIQLVKNYKCDVVKPNQTHDQYITWDIGCNSDISLDLNYFDWQNFFDYFKYSERDLATFATKFVNKKLLRYNPQKKIRVRLSLMPEEFSIILEPRTSSISKRISFINELYSSGYEVHLNFSPVIYARNWKEYYKNLFIKIDKNISEEVKNQLKCEVIFLTHNEKLHYRNLLTNKEAEDLLWLPEFQESKTSDFGGENIRYNIKLKNYLIKEFRELLYSYLPYCKIKYIF